MAIALDSVSNGTAGTGTSSSHSHTIVAANATIYVGIGFDDAAAHDPSCTCGGVAMTRIENLGQGGGSDRGLAIFRLINPATGANTIAGSWTTSTNYAVASIAYTGVDATDPEDAAATSENVLNSVSQAVTSAVGDLVVGFVAQNSPTGSLPSATGAGHTNRALATVAQGALRISDLTGAASVTLTYTSDFEQWRVAGINLNVAAAGGATPHHVFGKMLVGPFGGPI